MGSRAIQLLCLLLIWDSISVERGCASSCWMCTAISQILTSVTPCPTLASFKDRPEPEVVGDAFKPHRIDRLHLNLSVRNRPSKDGVVDARR
jgi:hypothetical protein